MTRKADVQARHQFLHACFDELLACWIDQTGQVPSEFSLLDFVRWSHGMVQDPTCFDDREPGDVPKHPAYMAPFHEADAHDCPEHPEHDPTPENQEDVTSGISIAERDEMVKPR